VEYGTDKGLLKPIQEGATLPALNAKLPYTVSRPVQANGSTYLGFQDGSLRAFDANGKETWKEQVAGGIDGAPAIARGMLYVPSLNGTLYAFGNADAVKPAVALTGKQVTTTAWETVARREPQANAPAIVPLNDRLTLTLLATQHGWAQARLPNGAEAWIQPGDWTTLSRAGKRLPLWQNPALATVQRELSLPMGSERPVWSPDGNRIAFYLRHSLAGQFWTAQELGVHDLRTGVIRSIARGTFLNPHLSWSLDSKWVAFETYDNGDSTVWMANAEGGPLQRIADGDAPAWSPIAHRMAFLRRGTQADELWRINSNGEEAVKILSIPLQGYTGQFAYLNPPVWQSRGISLAVGADSRYYQDRRARLLITGLVERSQPTVISTPAEKVHSIAWSPDGRKLACVLWGHVGGSVTNPFDQRVTVYWLDGSQTPLGLPHTQATWVDNRHLAYVELSNILGRPSRIWLLDVETRRRHLLLESGVPVSNLAWIPGRGQLVLWTTSDYLRDGKYQPAQTRGWLIRLTLPRSAT
jgi:Tol biopolymer transport system component